MNLPVLLALWKFWSCGVLQKNKEGKKKSCHVCEYGLIESKHRKTLNNIHHSCRGLPDSLFPLRKTFLPTIVKQFCMFETYYRSQCIVFSVWIHKDYWEGIEHCADSLLFHCQNIPRLSHFHLHASLLVLGRHPSFFHDLCFWAPYCSSLQSTDFKSVVQ